MSLFDFDEETKEVVEGFLAKAHSQPAVLSSVPAPEYVTPYLIDPPEPISVKTKIWNEHLRLTKINLLEVCRVSIAHDVARAIEKAHGPDFFVKQPVAEGKNFVEYQTVLYTFTPAEFEAFVAGLRAQWEAERKPE